MRNGFPIHQDMKREKLLAKSEWRFSCSLMALRLQMDSTLTSQPQAPRERHPGDGDWSQAA
jgi:hypothetical protein